MLKDASWLGWWIVFDVLGVYFLRESFMYVGLLNGNQSRTEDRIGAVDELAALLYLYSIEE